MASSQHSLKQQVDIETQSITTHDDPVSGPVSFTDISVPRHTRNRLFWSFTSTKPLQPKTRYYLWNPPELSEKERNLYFKTDCTVLLLICFTFFVRYLDSSNISNAYVSGMKEDLNLSGADYNWLGQLFFFGYSIFGVFGGLLITRYPAHIVLPAFEFAWGLMCLSVIFCTNYTQLCLVRFIQGGLEGNCFPMIHYILGTYYPGSLLVSRTSIYISSGCLAEIFGGYIQSLASYIQGSSIAPWRWVFIIDFAVTTLCASLIYFLFPSPSRKTRWFSDEDFEVLKRNNAVIQNVNNINSFGKHFFRRVLTSWQFYVFNISYVCAHIPADIGAYWGIVLKDLGYDIHKRNTIPTLLPTLSLILGPLAGWATDVRKKKWEVLLVLYAMWILGTALLVKFDVSRPLLFLGYVLQAAATPVSIILVAWANEMCKEDDQLRASVLGTFNFFTLFLRAPVTLVLFNTENSPRFYKGMVVCLVFVLFSLAYTGVIIWFDRYQNRLRTYFDQQVNGMSVTRESERPKRRRGPEGVGETDPLLSK